MCSVIKMLYDYLNGEFAHWRDGNICNLMLAVHAVHRCNQNGRRKDSHSQNRRQDINETVSTVIITQTTQTYKTNECITHFELTEGINTVTLPVLDQTFHVLP